MTGGRPSQPLIWIARRGRRRYCTDRFLRVATILSKNSSPQLPTQTRVWSCCCCCCRRGRAGQGRERPPGPRHRAGAGTRQDRESLTSSHRRASLNAAWKSHSASSLPSMASSSSSSERAGGGRRSAGRGRGSGRCHSAASF